jgi:hypothetical protein
MELIEKRTAIRLDAGKADRPSKQIRDELKSLRKLIKQEIRKNRTQYYKELAEAAEKASNIGNQKEVYKIVRNMSGSRAGAVDLKGVDVDQWTGFFKDLLGKAKADNTIPETIRDKRAWKMAHEWIEDKSKYEKQWETPIGPPTFAEFTEASNKCVTKE